LRRSQPSPRHAGKHEKGKGGERENGSLDCAPNPILLKLEPYGRIGQCLRQEKLEGGARGSRVGREKEEVTNPRPPERERGSKQKENLSGGSTMQDRLLL